MREVMRPEILESPVHIPAYTNESLRVVVHRMAETGCTELPVIDPEDTETIVGTINLEDLLQARVRHVEEESRRERVLGFGLRRRAV